MYLFNAHNDASSVFIPTLQLRKLIFRVTKKLAQGHLAKQVWSQDLNPRDTILITA